MLFNAKATPMLALGRWMAGGTLASVMNPAVASCWWKSSAMMSMLGLRSLSVSQPSPFVTMGWLADTHRLYLSDVCFPSICFPRPMSEERRSQLVLRVEWGRWGH